MASIALSPQTNSLLPCSTRQPQTLAEQKEKKKAATVAQHVNKHKRHAGPFWAAKAAQSFHQKEKRWKTKGNKMLQIQMHALF